MDRTKSRKTKITYGGEIIDVVVQFVAGNRLSISVHPDLHVTANAPADQPWEAVKKRLAARAGWMVRQQREFARYHPSPTKRRYVSGETYYYLGRQYRLKVHESNQARVWMQGGYIHVATLNKLERPAKSANS